MFEVAVCTNAGIKIDSVTLKIFRCIVAYKYRVMTDNGLGLLRSRLTFPVSS